MPNSRARADRPLSSSGPTSRDGNCACSIICASPVPLDLALASSCILLRHDDKHSFHQDQKIEPRRPVLDIIQIMLDPSADLLDPSRLTAPSIHLRPAGYPGLNTVADQVLAYCTCVGHPRGSRCQGMRTRAHQRHIAAEHVDELTKLVH